MNTYQTICKVITFYLICACSCSDFSLNEIGSANANTQSNNFEKLKGRMKPADGKIDSFVGCRKSESILDTHCCFDQHTQTYFSDHAIIVKAVADGKVVKVRTSEQTKVHGIVIIRHGGYFTIFRNLDKMFVKEGDVITTARSIGEAGLGYSGTQKELLFEIYSNGQPINPKEWVLN